MNTQEKAEYIVNQLMLGNDAFSQWMGIQVVKVQLGFCQLNMTVKSEMLNGFKIGHGGIAYALGDSALAFAANTYGMHALTVETAISHIRSVKIGDELTVIARELSRTSQFGIYEAVVTNQNQQTVAILKGTLFIKSTEWINDTED